MLEVLNIGGNFNMGEDIFDFLSHPIQHTKSFLAGIFPKKQNYRNTIYIDKSNQRLHYYDKNGDLVLNSPISTGAIKGNKTKQGDLKTPEGKFKISFVNKNANKNKFGDTLFYGLSYGSGIGIHGNAGQPEAIGRRASHGCIRMPNGQLRCLQNYIGNGVGVPVVIEKRGGLIPKYQNTPGRLPEVTVTGINTKRFVNNDADAFSKALNDNRNLLMQTYNLSDDEYAKLSKLALNLASRETELGKGISYNVRRVLPDQTLHLIKSMVRKNDSPISRGLTQIKYDQDVKNVPWLKEQYNKFGINDSNLQNNFDKMALATVIRSIYNNKILQKNNKGKQYEYSDGTNIPGDEAAAIYWNRGKLTNKLNPNPSNSNDSVSKYIQKFRTRKIIQ